MNGRSPHTPAVRLVDGGENPTPDRLSPSLENVSARHGEFCNMKQFHIMELPLTSR